jgi:hypothetical protein
MAELNFQLLKWQQDLLQAALLKSSCLVAKGKYVEVKNQEKARVAPEKTLT